MIRSLVFFLFLVFSLFLIVKRLRYSLILWDIAPVHLPHLSLFLFFSEKRFVYTSVFSKYKYIILPCSYTSLFLKLSRLKRIKKIKGRNNFLFLFSCSSFYFLFYFLIIIFFFPFFLVLILFPLISEILLSLLFFFLTEYKHELFRLCLATPLNE